jgi:hypothetical protein
LEKKLADKKRRLIAENGKRPKINNNQNGMSPMFVQKRCCDITVDPETPSP